MLGSRRTSKPASSMRLLRILQSGLTISYLSFFKTRGGWIIESACSCRSVRWRPIGLGRIYADANESSQEIKNRSKVTALSTWTSTLPRIHPGTVDLAEMRNIKRRQIGGISAKETIFNFNALKQEIDTIRLFPGVLYSFGGWEVPWRIRCSNLRIVDIVLYNLGRTFVSFSAISPYIYFC